MTKHSELKSCPFCGSKPTYDDEYNIVTCCCAVNPMSLERWNTRVKVDERKIRNIISTYFFELGIRMVKDAGKNKMASPASELAKAIATELNGGE